MESIEIIAFLALAWSVVQSLLMYRSIPREAWDKMIDGYNERAAKTESDLDNKVGAAVENFVTPLFERFGIFKTSSNTHVDIDPKGQGNTTSPFDPMPETFEFVIDVFGTRGDAHKDPVSGAVIESPLGYNHAYKEGDSAHRAGKGGKVWNRKAVIVKPEYGMQVNVDSTAGKWMYNRDHQVAVDANQQYIVSLEYVGNVNPAAEVGYYNWIQANAYVNGQALQPFGETLINHNNLKNGRNIVSWIYTSDKTETVNLGFDLDVFWASAEGDSWIQFKSLTVQKKA